MQLEIVVSHFSIQIHVNISNLSEIRVSAVSARVSLDRNLPLVLRVRTCPEADRWNHALASYVMCAESPSEFILMLSLHTLQHTQHVFLWSRAPKCAVKDTVMSVQ